MSLPDVLPALDQVERSSPAGGLNVDRVRRLFPALDQLVHGKPLVYLDNGASTQKPRAVIDAVSRYYESDNANVHRGVHALSDRATARYEQARETVRRFLNAEHVREIVFVRGATEAINLVAQTFGRKNVGPGDEVIVTGMEHHANIVPWQMLCEEKGATLRVIPITDSGDLRLDALESLINPRTRLVAVSHVSNVLGTVNPVARIVEIAHGRGVPVLVDGAQAVPHMPVDVREIGADFYAFSGHKVYGPMGIGVLYGKLDRLEAMPPWQGGGDMVNTVSFEQTTYNEVPFRFEAGTPNVSGAVGLAEALDFLDRLGREKIAAHDTNLLRQAVERLREIPGVRLIGDPAERAGVVSFVVDDPPMSAYDVGSRLDLEGIAVRTGHHCCQPLLHRFDLPGTVRASFGLYNTLAEVDQLASALRSIVSEKVAPRTTESTDPAYPGATAPSVEDAAEEFLYELDGLDDWADRYGFLIELGRKLPHMPDALKTAENRVRGCQSIVFLDARARPGTSDVVEFLADADSELVRGLLALLQHLFTGQRASEILAFDLPGFLARIGLDNNLTTGRRNGLSEMIKRLHGFASSLANH